MSQAALTVLTSIYNSYIAEAQKIQANIGIALSNPNSIPDHVDFIEDIEGLIEKSENLMSLAEHTQKLIKNFEPKEENAK